MSEEKKLQPVLLFEKTISKKNRKILEDAGYAVVCTSSNYKVLAGGEVEKIPAMAFEFIAGNSASSWDKAEFGKRLVDFYAKELKSRNS